MIHLDKELQLEFEHILMIGILKTLKEEELLTDMQLHSAISKLENSLSSERN